MTIENKFFRRQMGISGQGMVTSSFVSAAGEPLVQPGIFEGQVTIDGQQHTLGDPQGAFKYQEHHYEYFPDGKTALNILFCSDSPAAAGVRVIIHYVFYDAIPVLIKSIAVENNSTHAIRLDGMILEDFVPIVTGRTSLILENDYVRDGMLVDGKRERSPWIEHQPVYIKALLNTRGEKTRFTYPVMMHKVLAAGERFESFRVFEMIVSNESEEVRGLEFRKITRALFPWTRKKFLSCFLSPARSLDELYNGISAASAAGYDGVVLGHGWLDGKLTSPLFTNYNDYILRPDWFPNGWSDVRKLTSFAHGLNLQIAFYTIYVETWRGMDDAPSAHRDNKWELIWAENDNSERWGYALDPATDWGLFVNRKIEEAIVAGDFDAYHLDGPYYGDINVSATCGLPPGGPNQVLAWERQKMFYQRMQTLGIHGEAAQGFCAFANGMNRITTSGYVEEDFGKKDIRSQILATRLGAYRFTKAYRPEQAGFFIPVVGWSPDKNAPSLEPLEENASLYSAYLANCFGYGFEGKCYQRLPYNGPKSKAALSRWLGFWNTYREFFKDGFILHIRQPDGQKLDAIMHILDSADSKRGLVVVYNPTAAAQQDHLEIPFKVAGFPERGWVAVSEMGKIQNVKDGQLSVSVNGFDATWYEVKAER